MAHTARAEHAFSSVADSLRRTSSFIVRLALEACCALRCALRSLGDAIVPSELVATELATGSLDAHVARSLASLQIASLLVHRGPMTALALASTLSLPTERLKRFLQFAAARGLISRGRNGDYRANRLTRQFTEETQHSAANFTQYFTAPGMQAALATLPEVLRTDAQAYDLAHGKDAWTYFREQPAEAAHFDKAMVAMSLRDADEIALRLGAFRARRLCDVGGGRGVVVSAVLRRYAQSQATVFDQPEVLRGSKEYLDQRNFLNRTTLSAGDFFREIPEAHSCYLLRNILHDWDDEDALLILKRCRDAMNDAATLAVVEAISVPSSGFAELNHRMDMVMMLGTTGGRQRSREDLKALLRRADLHIFSETRLRSLSELWLCRPL